MSASSKKKLRKEQAAAAMTEKQLAEQKEAKKLKVYSISFVAVLALIVVTALVVGGVTAFVNSGFLQRNTDAVTLGDATLSNADLNYFYVDQIQSDYNNWNQSYGENAQLFVMWMMGLDITKPLNAQVYDAETGKTFADYYKDMAVESAKNVYAIYNLAKAAGETLTEAQQEELDMTVETLNLYAAMGQYSDGEAYLKDIYGPGATLENYSRYLEVKTVATNYAQKYYSGIEVSDSDIAAHSKENYDQFSAFDYSVFFVDVNDFLPCLGQDVAEDHTHSAEELDAARKAAKEVAETLAASGATDTQALDAAIAEIEAYKGKESAKSGLRTKYTLAQVSEDQGKWLSAADRKAGDLAMLTKETTSTDAEGNKTTTVEGYNVMLFLGRDDREQNLVNVRHILASFKGGTTDANGNKTYNLSEKQAAKDAIEAIQKEWLANGGTVEAFEALAKEKTEDTGSKENGGLYEEVYPGQMDSNFNVWCFAEERKAGDYGIVETAHGYHLIYFVGQSENTYRQLLVEDALMKDRYTEWYNAQLEAVTVTELNTEYLSLDYIIKRY